MKLADSRRLQGDVPFRGTQAGCSTRLTGTSQNSVRMNAKPNPGKGDALAVIQLGTDWLGSCRVEKGLEILVGRELSVRL